MDDKNLIDGRKPQVGNAEHIAYLKKNKAMIKVSTYISAHVHERLGDIAKGQLKKIGRVDYYAKVLTDHVKDMDKIPEV